MWTLPGPNIEMYYDSHLFSSPYFNSFFTLLLFPNNEFQDMVRIYNKGTLVHCWGEYRLSKHDGNYM